MHKRILCFIGLTALGVVLGLIPVNSFVYAEHHAWHEDFEGLNLGEINGQGNWSFASEGNERNVSEVVDTEAKNGQRSLFLRHNDAPRRSLVRHVLYSPGEDITDQEMSFWFRKGSMGVGQGTSIVVRSFSPSVANICHFIIFEGNVFLNNGAISTDEREIPVGTYSQDIWTQLNFKITPTECQASMNDEPLQSVERLGDAADEDPFHILIISADPRSFYIDDIVPTESTDPFEKENQLAEKFKPILYFHEDEKYRPQEIKVALETGDLLKDGVLQESAPLDENDLALSTNSDYKLDLLGDIFINESPETGETYENTTYVHIVEDENRIALQYWFFYYFNDWDGAVLGADLTHEGDWEMIQLIFPENKTVQEIVEQDIPPSEAVYSAHLGGYKAEWNNVEKESDRPVVYVAHGSHANQFQPGFCDLSVPLVLTPGNTDKASNHILLNSIKPSQPIIDPVDNTEFNWLLFGGKWGVDANSPTNPAHQELFNINKWSDPFRWITDPLTQSHIIRWTNFYHKHCDGDFDGIWNNVDTSPDDPSDDFDAPGPFGRDTKGTITERGDREFKIRDSEVGGAHFEVSPGNEFATIELNGFFCVPRSTITFKPDEDTTRGIATCLSSEVSVEEGEVEFGASHNGLEVVATVAPKQTVHYDIVDDQLQIETSGEGEIPLTVNGKPTTVQAGETFSVQEVQLDIKPGSGNNPINCKAKGSGVIPVAILTTGDFDATTIDHTTVLFEGASELHAKRHEEDVDKDGDMDLIFHFRQNETALCESEQTTATLTGKTFSGDLFIGTDVIDMKNN